MQKTHPKIISISDLIQWHANGELELSPKYQRNKVWNEKAKSYLIDTILRGLPIPPVFLRQQVDISTRTTFREVVDGQQRIRAILEFADDGFIVKKTHNKEYGGLLYSQLDSDIKENFLQYEICAETVTEKDESIIYDMFARLNANNIALNHQEIRNSLYWGEFKVLVYRLSSKYRDFLLHYSLISDRDCSRMSDSELINSMVLLLSEGIIQETPSIVDKYYKKYDIDFPEEDAIERKVSRVMDLLERLYESFGSSIGCFSNKNYFFTLYCVIVNQLYGIKKCDYIRNALFSDELVDSNFHELKKAISNFIDDYETNITDKSNEYGKYSDYAQFAKNHTTRTTSKAERMYRIEFLNKAIGCVDCDS